LRSTKSSSRARRSSERGYALIAALVLAVLYFGLVELLMIDARRSLDEARRFRARIIAQNLAENGAELAAVRLASPSQTAASVRWEDEQGEITGQMSKTPGGQFTIEGTGRAAGLAPVETFVTVYGRVVELSPGVNDVRIQYTIHKP
jgi:Tfp pilus assembly protein PilX